MDEIASYSCCFVCGLDNAYGMKARFYYDGERAVTEIVADEQFAGYHGYYHGGVLGTLLDEVMVKSILARNIVAVTAEMTVRFLAPVKTGDRITCTGCVTRSTSRFFLTEGTAVSGDGTVLATAVGKYIRPKGELLQHLQESVQR